MELNLILKNNLRLIKLLLSNLVNQTSTTWMFNWLPTDWKLTIYFLQDKRKIPADIIFVNYAVA